MKHSTRTALLPFAVITATSLAASDRGTPDEAKAMMQKAVAHYKAFGRDQALKDFSAGKAPFRDRDLYVVCIAPNRKISANGAFPAYVGTSADALKDAKGNSLGGAILETLGAKGQPSITYPMINPMTGKPEIKTMYGQKVGEDVCGVGAYR